MIRAIIKEFKNMSKEFLGTVLFGVLLMVGLNAYSITNSSWELRIDMWTYGLDLFGFILPLIVSLPFGFKIFHEIKDGYLKNVFNRTHMTDYLKVKFYAGMLAAYISVLLILLLSLIISLYVLPMTPAALGDAYESSLAIIFNSLALRNPLAFGLIISIWIPVIGILFYVMTYQLAFISSNVFVVLTGAFIYSIVENFISAVLGLPQISLVTAQLIPRTGMIEKSGYGAPMIGLGIALLFIIVLNLLKKHNDLF